MLLLRCLWWSSVCYSLLSALSIPRYGGFETHIRKPASFKRHAKAHCMILIVRYRWYRTLATLRYHETSWNSFEAISRSARILLWWDILFILRKLEKNRPKKTMWGTGYVFESSQREWKTAGWAVQVARYSAIKMEVKDCVFWHMYTYVLNHQATLPKYTAHYICLTRIVWSIRFISNRWRSIENRHMIITFFLCQRRKEIYHVHENQEDTMTEKWL